MRVGAGLAMAYPALTLVGGIITPRLAPAAVRGAGDSLTASCWVTLTCWSILTPKRSQCGLNVDRQPPILVRLCDECAA